MNVVIFICFLAGLILPATYQRTKFYLFPHLFEITRLRKESGLNIHHGHFGFLLAFVATFLLLFGSVNIVSGALAGLGWGLMLDEIIPMLRMPSVGRGVELDVYKQSALATIRLILIVAVVSLVVYWVK